MKDYRAQATNRMNEAQRAYNGLRDKTTTYAREIAELLALHARVAAVWQSAPDDIESNIQISGGTPSAESDRSARKEGELLPCPFCGDANPIIRTNAPSSDIKPWPHVICLECG